MAATVENKLLAVVRVRGTNNVRESISHTLDRLNLKRINNLSFVFGTKSNLGMVRKCNDYITYGEVPQDLVEKLLAKKGLKPTGSVSELVSGKKTPKDLGIKMPLHMKPPRRGYRDIKAGFNAGGDLGYRGEKIMELVKRMM